MALALLALATAPACAKKVDEAEKIRGLIRAAAKAASARDIAGVLENVAEDFVGQVGAGAGLDDQGSGGLKRKEMRLLLFRYLRRASAPRVVIRAIEVQVQGDTASAEVMALLAQGVGEITSARPGQAEALKLDLELARRDGDWLVTRAKRTPIDPKRLLLAE